MNTEENNNSVKHRKIDKGGTQSSTTSITYVGGNLERLPIELIIEILTRLPAKTIALCRCVSKQWASLLRSPQFTKSFLASSSTRPRLLITFESGGRWHFFSSPHPQNVDETESVVTATYHRTGFYGDWNKEVCLAVNGLICLYKKEVMARVPVIWNPSTGQHVSLPNVAGKNKDLRSFLGYDPIENQYKVLCMNVSKYRQQIKSRHHQVCTLGKGKLSWRKIECGFTHVPEAHQNGICINGVLYYAARNNLAYVVACFDVKSEKLRFIEIEVESSVLISFFRLIKYKGKLGALVFDDGDFHQLWVLDDVENEKWSKHAFRFTVIRDLAANRSIWGTDTGEIVWARTCLTHPFSVYYYNVERRIIRGVEIKGIEDILLCQATPAPVFVFTNHVENMMMLQ